MAIIFTYLGASVTIANVSVTILDVAVSRQGPHQNRSSMLGSDGSMAFFGLLIDGYNVVEAKDLA